MAGGNPKHFNLQDDPFELFLLGEGEKKIEEKVFSGMSNTSDFVLMKEDHTLGNLLSEHLKMHPNVYMAGYKSTDAAALDESCADMTDGTITPRDVFTSVCEKLIKQLEMLHQEFTREWELRRITNTGEQGNLQNGH
ncbi:DNA-directed rna polymerase ii subunit rpb11 [Fusarium tjaetaba]|uniref:DNA-directed rna polymerase ii subunit rpb11 n=2 Tax=Fusarium fujikuroi species complex TaxID=171627 RepID=A0A8H5JHQ0_9HYPO|nr:DNA-directed rna polymerase ii subunit rpb11 [Fusarium tjaetaba]KAF5555553.1 DNA-directed rna polymerase ii subunit rpb11 [Fusarium napiforme]KAF5639700.1 DNA-directed rna polymerase ii subunit rpb11 [Fusarium tjaetaba]